MNLQVLSSGSQGNCYLLETEKETLIIECGIKWREIKKALHFDFSKVIGCLCSHCHKDHSKALQDVLKTGIDIYCSKGTADALNITGHRIKNIQALKQYRIGDFVILPFPTEHDAPESLGFLIQYLPTGEKLLFATDTYYIRNKFIGLNYIMVECNYIRDTLDANIEAGIIPEGLRSRLLQSHFELNNVKEFLKANDLSQCRKIILLHLSSSNSDAKRMVKEVNNLTGIDTVIADAGVEVELEMFPF